MPLEEDAKLTSCMSTNKLSSESISREGILPAGMDYRMKLCIYLLLRYMFSMKASAVLYKVGELKKKAMGFGYLLAFGVLLCKLGN